MDAPFSLNLHRWQPTPTQWNFARRQPKRTRRQLLDRTRIRLLAGGLGSGKTATGARAFVDAVRANPPGTASRMATPTQAIFDSFMRPEFEAALPPGTRRSPKADTGDYSRHLSDRLAEPDERVFRSRPRAAKTRRS
jgi:hypothetical protein